MNRITKIQSLNQINQKEIELGISGDLKKSWHQDYKDSAWVYIGGLPYDLNEGDILAVFSQYGEIVNLNLVRDYKTGKSKGFCFLCYQDQRSTVLAVDNFNGIKLVGRIIQVDHCAEYKPPKYKESVPEEIRKIWEEGCAPKPINIPEERLIKEAEEEKRRIQKQLEKYEEVAPLNKEQLDKELRKARKKIKKEQKKEKKRIRREKKLARRSQTPEDERGNADDAGHWDAKKKKLDKFMDDEEFYGSNDHFNFGKKRKELPPAPTHNIRPDFDKADWRDIEMFKIIREKERQEKGEKVVNWKEEEHFLPNRLGGGQ